MLVATRPQIAKPRASSSRRGAISVRQALKRDLPWVAGVLMFAFTWSQVVNIGYGADSHAYWRALHEAPYTRAPAQPDAYLYSPAFLHALSPLEPLSWPVFSLLWTAAAVAGVVWLLAPVGWRRGIPLFLICSYEITSGNIFWLFAIVAVIGLRHPSAWVVPALTKITPALGPVWFLVRGEWRHLLVSCSTIVLVAAASWTLSPSLWHDWMTFLGNHVGDSTSVVGSPVVPPPMVRVPAAVGLVIWGARTNRIWTLPAAMAVASPVFGASGVVVVLMAIPRLNREYSERRADRGKVLELPN